MKKIFREIDDFFAKAGEAEYIGTDIPSEESGEYTVTMELGMAVPHAEPGALQAIKSSAKGHGEQTVLPDDCEFGDNDLCYVDA